MTVVAHSSISIISNLVVLSFFNYTINLWHLLAMIVFSWLPDVDSPSSLAGKMFFFVSKKINVIFGHRGFLHSITFLSIVVLLTFAVFIFAPQYIYIYFIIFYVAYISHLIADCFNISGVRLLYPKSTVYVFPFNDAFRFRSGNMKIELPIFITTLIFSGIFYFTVMENQGLISYLRIKFANPSMAEEQFTSFEKSKYFADVVIYDKISRQNIDFKNVEVLFSDKNKIIFFQDKDIKFFEDSDIFKISKVSLRKSDLTFDKESFSGDLKSLLETDFRAASGVVYCNVDYKNHSITKENGNSRLFFSSKTDIKNIIDLVDSENNKILSDIEDLKLQTSIHKIRKIKNSLSVLNDDKEVAVRELQKTDDIKTKLDLSDRIRRTDSKIDSLTLELSLIDTGDDDEVLKMIKENQSKIIESIKCDLTVIK